MSDTPRTDEMFSTETALSDGELVVPISFARQLERENAALNETARKHVAAYYELLDENTALRKQLKEAQP